MADIAINRYLNSLLSLICFLFESVSCISLNRPGAPVAAPLVVSKN